MRLHTSIREDAHAYTRSTTPWIIDERMLKTKKLIHYISGGGMRSFGRTVSQEETLRRHIRFYVFAGIFGIIYFALYCL